MQITLLNKSDIKSSTVLSALAHPNINNAYAVQATDFAILTGAILDNDLPNRNQYAQFVWTKSTCNRSVALDYGTFYYDVVTDISSQRAMWANSREACILPVIDLKEAEKERDFKMLNSIRAENNAFIKLASVGAYPQSLADNETSAKLTQALKRNQLTATGKTYTVNASPIPWYTKDTNPQNFISLQEYEFEGEKYVQIIANLNQDDDKTKDKIHLQASNRTIKNKKPYWIKVEPIVWLVDEVNGVLVSQKGILSGIRFDKSEEYKGQFSQTEMKTFCDKYLSNEIINREAINLNNFKSFALAQLKNKADSLQRIQYFQQLLLLIKLYLAKPLTGNNLSEMEQEIVNYTKKHVQNMTSQPNATPEEMLNQFCQKTEEPKVMKNKNTSFLSRLRDALIRD